MGFSLSDAHDKWQEDKNKAQGESDSGNNWLSELWKGEHESDSSDSDGAEASAGKNNGGFGAGLGYLGQKYVGGVVSNIEGMVDLVQGGFVDLIGQDEYAKKVFEEDWYDYDAADKKFNPGTGWKVAGDVAGVLGSATPDIIIGIGTGAAGLGGKVIGKGISLATSFASGAGRGVSEAVKNTGMLGAKEWLGGSGSGVLAAGIEGVSGLLGDFTGNIIGRTSVEFGSEIGEAATKRYSSEAIGSALGKAVSKETASEIGSEAGEGAIKGFIRKLWGSKGVKELLGEAVSEGGEEFFETLLEPYIIQSTYDPSHPEASVNDLLYSAFLGAAGGGLISGGVQGVNAGINSIRGAKLTGNSNSLSNLFSSADAIVDYENNKNTGSAVFSAISEVYNSIKESMGANGGRITLSTMEKIGELEGLVSTAVLQPSVVNAAKGIARNSEKMAEALNNFYKKTGSDRRITAEQLTDGLKLDGTSQQFVNSVTSALKTNGIFREVVINNMLGRLEFDSRAYANAIFGDIPISTIATQQNLNRFLAKSDAATLQQVGEALGVEDWAKLTPEKLAEKLQFFRDSGASKAYEGGVLAMKKAKATTAYTNGMPSSISSLKNGATRFKAEGLDFAIIRDGKGYRLYDYESGSITKVMSRGEMEALMQRLKEWQSEAGKESELAALDRELDGFALENVPEYKSLTESEREAVRATLRYARANGISLKDQILFARIAAKSGMNIIAVPSLEGNKVAWYDGRNSIYLDASAPRTRSFKALLGHEMWHKMFKAKKIKKPFMQAWNKIDEGKRKSIIDQYMAEEQRQGKSPRESAKVSAEEVAAAYAEEVFNFPHVWDFVLDGEPTLKDKVIAFFKGSPKRYSFAPEMDPAARAWLREYKKLFDEVARLNAGENVAENVGLDKKVLRVLGKVVDEDTGTVTKVPEKVIRRIGKIVPEDKKNASNTKNAQDSGERYAIHYPKFTKQDIEGNIKDIALMESVRDIFEDRLKKTGKKPRDIYQEFFDSLGNSIYSPVFGDIELSKSSAKSEVGHGNWSGKIASIEAIPDVILKGKVIFHRKKGDATSSVERIVVAAPIKIGDENYYMGVMLQRDSHTQRLYLHNVAAIKEEEAKTTSQADRLTYGAYEEDSNLFITSILQNAINVKLNDEKILTDSPEALGTLTKPQALSLIQRGVKGDDLLNASDLAAEILSVGGKITSDGKAVLYHGTTKQNADNIRATGTMYGKEDGLFFSTKRDGLVLDYGKNVVEVKIPLEKLILDDIFDDEAHLRIPVKPFKYTDVEVTKESFDSGERSALADGKRATATEVAAVKKVISEMNIDPRGIMAVADSYFGRYEGSLTRTGLRYEFLDAARSLLSLEGDSLDVGYAKVEALADELTYNEKDVSGFSDDLKEIQRHIREITFAVKDQDKGEFDSLGGFGAFRRKHFGKIKIANDGTSVDAAYGELQTLYGLSLFPDINTAQEMLIRIAEVVDMDPKAQANSDIDLEAASADMTMDIMQKLVNAFEKKLPAKTVRMSKADADSYKARINARADVKAAKAIAAAKKRLERLEAKISERIAKATAKAEARADQTIETERTKLAAEYETDRVFSQATVNKALGGIEAFKTLPAKDRTDISKKIWRAFNESNGYDSREWTSLVWTTQLTDLLVKEQGESVSSSERKIIFDQVNAAVNKIAAGGRKSVRANMEGELREEIKATESVKRRILSEIYQELKKIDDVKTARFAAASDYKGHEFKGSIERLTRMDWRGELNESLVRKEMKNLLVWYHEGNPMLQGFESGDLKTTTYNKGIRERIDALANGTGELSNDELGMLSDTLKYFTKLVSEYDMVYIEGKWQSGETVVYSLRNKIKLQEKMKLPMIIRAMRHRILSGDLREFADPISVIKLADMYEDGIFTKTYNDWMWGEINAEAEALAIKEEYDSFMQSKNNKNYLAKAKKDTVEIHGAKINRLQLVSYVMTLKRKGSWLGIAHEGVVFKDDKGQGVPMRPIRAIPEGKGFNQKLEAAIRAEQSIAERLLTAKDREYMQILERGFERAKATKAAADMQRLGFVNVLDGYYYPIRRAYTEHLSEFEAEMFTTDRYANASFNKKAVQRAKSALLIGSADAAFNSHVRGVSRYMYLSPVMDSFNKLYKLKLLKTKPGMGADISALYALPGSTFSLQSLIDQAENTWRQDGKVVGFDYLQNLMLDTMGGGKRNVGDDITDWLRSNYVGFALGANPKVLATQFSSLFASTSILNARAHLRASLVSGRGVDNYSVVAKLRNSDYTVLKSNAVSDRVSELSKWFTQGMSLFDRIVVKRAFAAAQAQVAQRGGPKIGTKENLIAAGKLLDKVILETQQNAISSRKTEAARRGNMLVKTMIMFKSDAITMQGRVIDAWGEWRYLLAKKNAAGTEASGIDKNINRAKKKLARSIGAVLGSSVYMLIVAETFRHLYGKADENETEDEKRKRLWLEMVSNLVGGMPIVSTVIEVFTSGYDLESMEFSAINDILSTSKQIVDLFQEAAQGKATKRDYVRMAEKLLYTAGQTFGLPFRNVKNVVYGITKILNPEAAYKWDSALYDQSYGADFEDAIEKDDLDMAVTILELAFGERMGSGLSDKAIAELMRLAKIGENVLPSAIGDSITIDGEERELTGEELKAVREKYSEAVERINVFVESDLYKDFDNEQKADAVRKIYSLYKNLAYDSVLGTERDKEALILSKIIDADILCANEALSVMRADKDEDGKTISGSRREKIVAAINEMDLSDEEKLMLIATNGFKLKDGDIEGVSKEMADDMLYDYIAGLDLSEEEKNALYEYCGYEIKDGEVTGSAASGSSSSSGSSSGSTSSKRKGSSSLPGGDRLTGGGKLSGANEKKVVKIGKLDTSKIEKRIVRIGKLV